MANPVGVARVLPLPSQAFLSTAASSTGKPPGLHLIGTSSLWVCEEGKEVQTQAGETLSPAGLEFGTI